jgi:hypothetical protein
VFGYRSAGRVPAEQARQIVTEELGQLVAGMDQVGTGLRVGPLSDRHRSTLRIAPLKGGALVLSYGVSCSWVPHPRSNGFTWQRTARQARPCLWVDQLTPGSPFPHEIDTLSGEKVLRRTARHAVRHTIPHAGDWWDAVRTPEGVLREACRQASDEYAVAYPHPGFVAAFTLSALGRLEDAEAELGRADVVHPAELLPEALVLLRDVAGSLAAR